MYFWDNDFFFSWNEKGPTFQSRPIPLPHQLSEHGKKLMNVDHSCRRRVAWSQVGSPVLYSKWAKEDKIGNNQGSFDYDTLHNRYEAL